MKWRSGRWQFGAMSPDRLFYLKPHCNQMINDHSVVSMQFSRVHLNASGCGQMDGQVHYSYISGLANYFFPFKIPECTQEC